MPLFFWKLGFCGSNSILMIGVFFKKFWTIYVGFPLKKKKKKTATRLDWGSAVVGEKERPRKAEKKTPSLWRTKKKTTKIVFKKKGQDFFLANQLFHLAALQMFFSWYVSTLFFFLKKYNLKKKMPWKKKWLANNFSWYFFLFFEKILLKKKSQEKKNRQLRLISSLDPWKI